MYTSISIRRAYLAVTATIIKSAKTTTIVKETGAISSSICRKTVISGFVGEQFNTAKANNIMGGFSVIKTKLPHFAFK